MTAFPVDGNREKWNSDAPFVCREKPKSEMRWIVGIDHEYHE